MREQQRKPGCGKRQGERDGEATTVREVPGQEGPMLERCRFRSIVRSHPTGERHRGEWTNGRAPTASAPASAALAARHTNSCSVRATL
jgi:hypothetical protein